MNVKVRSALRTLQEFDAPPFGRSKNLTLLRRKITKRKLLRVVVGCCVWTFKLAGQAHNISIIYIERSFGKNAATPPFMGNLGGGARGICGGVTPPIYKNGGIGGRGRGVRGTTPPRLTTLHFSFFFIPDPG